MTASLNINAKVLQAFCQSHGIEKLSLFGSALRDDFGPESDLDFLVVFREGTRVSYFDLAAMEQELAQLLGTSLRVDLRTPQELSRYFRQEVIDSAEVQYDAA